MPDPDGLLEQWSHEGSRTLRLFAVFDDVDLAWAPVPGGRTVGELLRHVADGCDRTARCLLSEEPWSPLESPLRSVEDARDRLQEAQRRLFEALRHLPAVRFEEEVQPFGRREMCGVMAFGMLKHELHHRGELQALAKIRRRPVPSLYQPLEREP
jgi:uncharacterized damage-inducible protein DinB